MVVDRGEDVRIASGRGLPEEVFHVKHRRVRASDSSSTRRHTRRTIGTWSSVGVPSGMDGCSRRADRCTGRQGASKLMDIPSLRRMLFLGASGTSYAVRPAPLLRTSTSLREQWVFHVKHRRGRCVRDLRSLGVVRCSMNGRDPVRRGERCGSFGSIQ